MLQEDLKMLANLNKNILFRGVMEKLTTDKELDYDEKSYVLACAILFIRHYEKDKRHTNFADFSYYIILKYSLNFKDYLPLYDYSINFGFYPIAKTILKGNLLEENPINSCFTDLKLDKFKNKDDNYQTLEQHVEGNGFFNDKTNEKSYVAPTSFGKSSLMVDYIKSLGKNLKIVIVVPTKSLLMQTYQMVRDAGLDKKVIIHDEMYGNDSSLICIFTQERSLRLLSRDDFYFDVLIIDEAHNLLKEDDGRSILLSRLISKNRLRKPDQHVVYLSPLIQNSENLKIHEGQEISSHVVNFNVKEPELFEYRLNNEIYKYNRFLNRFYLIDRVQSSFEYLIKTSGQKNFIYNYRPIKIELLSNQLYNKLPKIIKTEALLEVEKVLAKEVHKDFYGIKYLECGLVYLHGKLPDLLKEYLEFKFKNLSELRYVVANSVILEGMNLPIDTLFVFNTRGLNGKELMNLIGRVNRLNTIFGTDNVDLQKLLPKIHFINNQEHNKANSKMENKITLLRSRVFDDEVENPILSSFDIEKLDSEKRKNDNYLDKVKLIQENEKFLYSESHDDGDLLKKYLIESGVGNFYDDIGGFIEKYSEKVQEIVDNKNVAWEGMVIMEKIYYLFTYQVDKISDLEIKRLNEESARNFYENYILIERRKSLNERINSQFKYFKERILTGNSKFFFGKTYGEETYESNSYQNSANKVYVDLSNKSDKELINLAVVKLKIEDDFISFKLNKFIVMMNDYQLINEDEYNEYIYGTTDKDKINLTKFGLSLSLISRLEKDGQLGNIFFDEFNNLRGNSEFEKFVASADDFYRFEIGRHIDFSSEL